MEVDVRTVHPSPIAGLAGWGLAGTLMRDDLSRSSRGWTGGPLAGPVLPRKCSRGGSTGGVRCQSPARPRSSSADWAGLSANARSCSKTRV